MFRHSDNEMSVLAVEKPQNLFQHVSHANSSSQVYVCPTSHQEIVGKIKPLEASRSIRWEFTNHFLIVLSPALCGLKRLIGQF